MDSHQIQGASGSAADNLRLFADDAGARGLGRSPARRSRYCREQTCMRGRDIDRHTGARSTGSISSSW